MSVILHQNVPIGADGFGYVPSPDGCPPLKVPQVGTVLIEDEVEIGAGTKIDNAVHVGHNCEFGRDNAIAALCAFAGSTVLGDRVTGGGHTIFGGHQKIGDDVRIGGNSGVRGDVTEPGDFMGWPLMERARWARTMVVISKLADLQPHLRGVLPKKRKKRKPDR